VALVIQSELAPLMYAIAQKLISRKFLIGFFDNTY